MSHTRQRWPDARNQAQVYLAPAVLACLDSFAPPGSRPEALSMANIRAHPPYQLHCDANTLSTHSRFGTRPNLATNFAVRFPGDLDGARLG